MKKLLLTITSLLLVFGFAPAEECHIDKTRKNLVKFISHATLDNFEGVTDRIDGYVIAEGEGLKEGQNCDKSELYFEVALEGLDTGIGLRNRHMRENYLETSKFPYTHFAGKLDKVEKGPQGGFLITASGKFYIHGIEKPLTITASVTPQSPLYHITTEFQVKLSDFNIKIPSLMFMKLSDTQIVRLDFYVKTMENKK
ncbi:MAG: YceI family protein [candidate division Zixibacteria bacterium]|nr:YceI family protein [candidate division Zixibacteria bacterium]